MRVCPDASEPVPQQARGMRTTELMKPPQAPSPPEPTLEPPVVLVAGPCVLLSLVLAGPFALVVTFVVFLTVVVDRPDGIARSFEIVH